jgi:hypothetical protein
VFLTSYVVILLVLVESIVSVHLDDMGRARMARQLDLSAAVASVAIFPVGVGVALL